MLHRLDAIVLGLLAGRPRTGYDVRKWFDRHGRGVGYSPQTSQIYRQLGRLVDRGCTSVEAEARSGGPDAKVYRLTDAGRADFHAWIGDAWTPSERPLDPDLQVRLQFAHHLPPAAVLERVRSELVYRRAQHRVPLRGDDSILPEGVSDAERAWAEELTLLGQQRGRLLAGNLISWLEAAEARLAFLAARDGDVFDSSPSRIGLAVESPRD